MGCLAAVGWILAGRSKGESSVLLSLFTYLAALTALSTSMADQYLAIPLIAAAACCRSPAAMVYTLLGGAILLESPNNVMRLTPPESTFIKYYHAQIALLFLLGWMFRSPRSEALRAVERGEAPRPLTGTP